MASRYNSDMRLFYAAYLSRENMDAYQTSVDRLIRDVPGVLRSIPHRTHHLTLAFVGDIADDEVDLCSSALDVLDGVAAFEISLGPPALLKGRGRPRLIRVGITEGQEEVQGVQAAIISRVSEDLPSIDTRSKPPHITLARFKKNANSGDARAVERALDRYLEIPLPLQDRFASAQLVKSTLTPSGPIYETLREVHLVDGP